MSLLPDVNNVDLEEDIGSDFEEEETLPSLTFRLDKENKRIAGLVDGDEAMSQAVFMLLHTEQTKYPIFSWDFGAMFEDLYGMDQDYVESEVMDRIEEAVLADDRFEAVHFTKTEWKKSSLIVEFTVTTSDGREIEEEFEMKS